MGEPSLWQSIQPLIAVSLGGGIAAVTQVLVGRRQQRLEATRWRRQERRDAYADFLRCMQTLRYHIWVQEVEVDDAPLQPQLDAAYQSLVHLQLFGASGRGSEARLLFTRLQKLAHRGFVPRQVKITYKKDFDAFTTALRADLDVEGA